MTANNKNTHVNHKIDLSNVVDYVDCSFQKYDYIDGSGIVKLKQLNGNTTLRIDISFQACGSIYFDVNINLVDFTDISDFDTQLFKGYINYEIDNLDLVNDYIIEEYSEFENLPLCKILELAVDTVDVTLEEHNFIPPK